MFHRRLAVVALLGAGCGAPALPAEMVTVVPVPEPVVATTAAASATAAVEPARGKSTGVPSACGIGLVLYVRHEAHPRPPAFDAAARAFDRASYAFDHGRFLEAARGFMKAAEGFLFVEDVENRRWSYGNAVWSWEMIGNLEEARMALLDATWRDAELAEELRQLASELTPVCPPEP